MSEIEASKKFVQEGDNIPSTPDMTPISTPEKSKSSTPEKSKSSFTPFKSRKSLKGKKN